MTEPFPAISIKAHPESQERHGPWRRKMLGSFETWICLGCGYTEFYARGLEEVEALAAEHPERLRIVDAEPKPQGPFR